LPRVVEMAEQVTRRDYTGLTVGFILIALAVSILVAYSIDKWWYFVPIFLIFAGSFGLLRGAMVAKGGTKESRSTANYLLTWGGIMVIIGALLVVNDLLPGNLVVLIAVFLIFVGGLALAIFALRGKG